MEKAKDMELQEKKNKVYKDKKKSDDNTAQVTQMKQVNEIEFDDHEEINFIQNRRPDPRFNSTMKPGHNGNHSQHSSGYQTSSPRNSFNNQSRSPRQNQSNQSFNNSYRPDRHGGQPRYTQNGTYNPQFSRSNQSGYNQGGQNQSGYNTGYNQGKKIHQ